MLYREFGNTGWKVSAVGMGTWNIGNQWGPVEPATAWSAVRSSFEHGVNLFDAAESYGIPNGLSEERLGQALAGIRHRVYVVTKIGNWGKRTGQAVPKSTVDMIRLCAHACLHRLRSDWIDVLLCHEGNIEDPTVYLEAFETLRSQGLVRAYGISTNSLEVLKRFNREGRCEVAEVEHSLLVRNAEEAYLPYCREHGIAVLTRGSLGQGLLSGRYSRKTVFDDTVRSRWHETPEAQQLFEQRIDVAERLKKHFEPGEEMVTAALRYSLSQPGDPVTIPGAKDAQQAIMNARAGVRALSDTERQRILEAIG